MNKIFTQFLFLFYIKYNFVGEFLLSCLWLSKSGDTTFVMYLQIHICLYRRLGGFERMRLQPGNHFVMFVTLMRAITSVDDMAPCNTPAVPAAARPPVYVHRVLAFCFFAPLVYPAFVVFVFFFAFFSVCVPFFLFC